MQPETSFKGHSSGQEQPEVLPSQATFLMNMPLGRPLSSLLGRSEADAVDACAVASGGAPRAGCRGTFGVNISEYDG